MRPHLHSANIQIGNARGSKISPGRDTKSEVDDARFPSCIANNKQDNDRDSQQEVRLRRVFLSPKIGGRLPHWTRGDTRVAECYTKFAAVAEHLTTINIIYSKRDIL